jgi:hypothetical protein
MLNTGNSLLLYLNTSSVMRKAFGAGINWKREIRIVLTKLFSNHNHLLQKESNGPEL